MPIPQLVSNPRRNSFHGLEELSQTFIEGDFVTLDATSGEVELFAYASGAKLLGLAQKDSAGVTSTAQPVTQIWPGDIIALDCYDSQAAAAADYADYVPGKLYELLMTGSAATTRWYAELEAAHSGGQAILICEGVESGSLKDKLKGTARSRGQFRVLDTHLLQHVGQ